MSAAVSSVASVDELFRLDPLGRFQALIDGDNFAPALRAEPIVFEIGDPTFGYGCRIEDCQQHSTQAGWWCTRHAEQRRVALRGGGGEAQWKMAAVPFPLSRRI